MYVDENSLKIIIEIDIRDVSSISNFSDGSLIAILNNNQEFNIDLKTYDKIKRYWGIN